MKRSHNYSSSESDLDDNVEVEKDSGDENGYVQYYNDHYIMYYDTLGRFVPLTATFQLVHFNWLSCKC